MVSRRMNRIGRGGRHDSMHILLLLLFMDLERTLNGWVHYIIFSFRFAVMDVQPIETHDFIQTDAKRTCRCI